MAEARARQFSLRGPGAGPKSTFEPRARYTPRTDTLLLYFYGGPEPAINVDVENSPLYLMVDPDTDELVGVHIQAFTSRFVPEHPHFRSVDVTRWSTGDHEREAEPDPDDAALQKSLAEMVIGSLVVEYGLRAP